MLFLYFAGCILGGLLIGFIIAKLVAKNRLLEKEKEIEHIQTDFIQEKQEIEKTNSVLLNQVDNLENSIFKLGEDITQYKSKIDDLRNEKEQLEKKISSKEEAFKHLEKKIEEEQDRILSLEKRFRIEFENIANKILKENTQEFNMANTKSMAELLNPLKNKINQFEKKVEETYEKGLKDQTDLKVELKKLHDLSLALDKDAKDLTRALKADSKKQGNWGEVILERVLERSGLIKDQEYFLQFSAKSEDGNTLRPDVVIRLPEEKHLVIDSKVSLTAYTEYSSTENDVERDVALKRHLDSVKKHVKELGEKDYSALLGINSPDFVLMFLPIEPAFGLAVQSDQDLFNYAWQRKVVIVSPTTLLATLRTVASIWKYEKQSQNAIEIAKRGGLLYDKFVSFIKDFENIGSSISKAGKVYDDAHKKLTSGRGDIVSQAEQLKIMGVTTKKSLPSEYLESEE